MLPATTPVTALKRFPACGKALKRGAIRKRRRRSSALPRRCRTTPLRLMQPRWNWRRLRTEPSRTGIQHRRYGMAKIVKQAALVVFACLMSAPIAVSQAPAHQHNKAVAHAGKSPLDAVVQTLFAAKTF